MTVRELFMKLGLAVDKSSFDKGEKALASVRAGLLAVGAATAAAGAALAVMVRQTADAGDRIDKTSQRLGLTRNELQEFEHVAALSSVGVDTLSDGLKDLGIKAAEAARTGGPAAEAYWRLGISIRDASGRIRPTGELFELVADRLGKIADPAEKARLATVLMGGSGQKLIPILNEGAASIAAMRQEAHDLGAVLGDEAIDASARFGSEVYRIQTILRGLRNLIAGPLLGPIDTALAKFIEWYKVNRLLIASSIEGVLEATAAAAKSLAPIIGTIAKTLLRVVGVVGYLVPALKWLGAALVGVTATVGLYNLGLAAMNLQHAILAAGGIGALIKSLALLTVGYLQAGAAGIIASLPIIGMGLGIAAIILLIAILADEIYGLWTGASGVFSDIAYLFREMLDLARRAWESFSEWISEAAVGLVDVFAGVWDSIKSGLTTAIRWYHDLWMGLINKIVGMARELPSRFLDAAKGVAKLMPGGEFVVNRMFGGGASPEASASNSPSAPGKSTVVSNNNTIPITINIPPGANPEEVATLTREQVEDVLSVWMDETAAAVS